MRNPGPRGSPAGPSFLYNLNMPAKNKAAVLRGDKDLSFPHALLISASAGSGKTYTLTQRYVQFLLSEKVPGNDLPNILAVTFTNNAAKEMKRKIVIIGYDSGKQQKAAVASGEMAGAITQNPVGMGYKTVEAAVKALKGEKLPKVIDTGFYWWDKSNMNDPKIAAVLYD